MGDYNSEVLALADDLSPLLVDQFLRTLGYAYYGVTDVCETFAAAHRIDGRNLDSVYRTWKSLADTYLDQGESKLAAGYRVSARRAFLRAAEYNRAAHFFLRESLWDRRVLDAVADMAAAADSAFALCPGFQAERVSVPFENSELLGIAFVRGGETGRRRPTILAVTGYDSFVEEYYQLAAVEDAIARGYNLAVFDGPGQGHTLLRNRLTMRPDYETVLPRLLDWVLDQPFVEPGRVAVMGRSFGGYLAPRGLLGETRAAALVVDPGQVSMRDAVLSRIPEPVKEPFLAGDRDTVNRFFDKALANRPEQRFFLKSRAAVHGVETVHDYFVEMMRFDFRDRAGELTVPTLATDNPHDFATRGTAFLEALTNAPVKQLARFEAEAFTAETRTGGGAHCEQGYNLPFEMCAFDWISEQIGHRDEI